ncbi:MAG: putative DNA binding domain-containing protein [Sphaerochaeta sp.]|nr:putative DNA binding domain-containing protein [Sphaerochaeta sp.]
METTELIEIIARGEDSKNQFKENLHKHDQESLAGEMVAFSNSGGGRIIIGVKDDDWSVSGLSQADVNRINQYIGNVASQLVKPSINPTTENIMLPDGLVMVVTVSDGISKPYQDKNSYFWVKSGSDKRKATSREEIQRMFQSASLIHGDELPANGLLISDIDMSYFDSFFQKTYGESLDQQDQPIQTLLENMNLAKSGNLNIAGALLFARQSHFRLPTFIVKAVAYPGNDIDEESYIDSRDIIGKVTDLFQQSISFITNNIQHHQYDQSVNSPGKPVIPRIVLEELIANAIIHRDYCISAPIRIFVFKNRVEIISPGHLPNNLTIENIKAGNSNIRNPILASFATKLLPYRGLGNGIRRAIKEYPSLELVDDRSGNLFKVIIPK